jgi:fatty-acyl-CoA synthase
LYCAMPLFHGNALLANLLAGLVAGSTVVLRRRFSATSFLSDVRESGATFFNYVGRTLSYILAVPETRQDADNDLKWAVGSEASMADRRAFTHRFGCYLYEGYGSSENAVVIVPGAGMPPGALGRPRPGSEVGIYDRETGRQCELAEFDGTGRLVNSETAIGEIVGLNAAGRFEGYYENPEADAERLAQGWYWTGDLGYRDSEGWIFFAGRTTDWLRVDGENLAAGPVERVLERYPRFSGVAVYGVPDPVTGDQVMATVQMTPASPFDPGDFAAFIKEQADLGTKWLPRFIAEVSDLPLTGTGKVDKAGLRRRQWQGKVWWRGWDRVAPAYRLMTDEERADLAGRFRRHNREHLIHQPV